VSAHGAWPSWSQAARIELRYITLGRPIQNAFFEDFNSRLGDEY
jgi:hypothetical protein